LLVKITENTVTSIHICSSGEIRNPNAKMMILISSLMNSLLCPVQSVPLLYTKTSVSADHKVVGIRRKFMLVDQ
jgi:hypothetical protein